MLEKLKIWFQKTGLTNVSYLLASLVALLVGSKILFGAAVGIFVYINFNVIQKIIRGILDKYKTKE